MDRQLIAAIVEREMLRNPELGTWTALERRTKVSHASMWRLTTANPKVHVRTFARVEAGLGLPSDTLVTAGKHDVEGLREIGVPEDLIRWIELQVKRSSAFDKPVGESGAVG